MPEKLIARFSACVQSAIKLYLNINAVYVQNLRF